MKAHVPVLYECIRHSEMPLTLKRGWLLPTTFFKHNTSAEVGGCYLPLELYPLALGLFPSDVQTMI